MCAAREKVSASWGGRRIEPRKAKPRGRDFGCSFQMVPVTQKQQAHWQISMCVCVRAWACVCVDPLGSAPDLPLWFLHCCEKLNPRSVGLWRRVVRYSNRRVCRVFYLSQSLFSRGVMTYEECVVSSVRDTGHRGGPKIWW